MRTLGGRPSRLGREKFWGLCRLEALPLGWAVKPGNEGLVTPTGVCGLRTLLGILKYVVDEVAVVSSLEEVSMRRIWGRLEDEAGWIGLRWDDEEGGRPEEGGRLSCSRSRSRSLPDAAAAATAAEEEKLLGRGEKLPGARCCERPDCILGDLVLLL